MRKATFSGPVAVDRERSKAAARNLVGENEAPQNRWLGRARKGSLWLCFTGHLAGRQKSGISDNRQRPKPTPWERNSWGS